MGVKQLDVNALVALGFREKTCLSWWYGYRRPSPDAMARIADRLDVPLSYLYGASTPGIDELGSARAVASRSSLEIFLQRSARRIPNSDRPLYELLASSSLAPVTVEGWQVMDAEIVRPTRQFEIQRGATMESDAAMAATTSKRSRVAANQGQQRPSVSTRRR